MTNLPELVIIKYLLKYSNYNKYYKYILISKDYREVGMLHRTLKELHERHPGTDKTVDELEATCHGLYPALARSERATLHELCERLRASEVSDEIAAQLVTEIAARNAARDLALKAINYAEGRGSKEDLSNLFDIVVSPSSTVGATQDWEFVTDDLDALLHTTIRDGGLYWPLASLNKSLGPLRKGDFGFVFARPETGKTTFLSHTAAFMAEQTKEPIIWVNNEERGEKVKLRIYQSALGKTSRELEAEDVDDNKLRFVEITGGRVQLWDTEISHKRDVEALVERYKPSLLIIDQIDKITGFDAERPDLVFGRIYRWARELAKSYCPVIGTCQADGTGEGVKWLTMSHVAEAKTTKQAEADWILGIGKSNEGGTEDVRFFNISKNKLMGDTHTDPELRHGRFDVWIRPQIARYQDIV